MGGCVGLAGCIAASQLSSAQANLDPGIIFDVLTIVVVAGHRSRAAQAAMWRTRVGLGIIATISNGFVLLDISPYYQSIIKGSIIVAALALEHQASPVWCGPNELIQVASYCILLTSDRSST